MNRPGRSAHQQPDAAPNVATTWPDLAVGTLLTIVKLAPTGAEAARYPGTVIDTGGEAPWVVVRATWVTPIIEADGLVFTPGDTLHEYFSPNHPFNVFAVFDPTRQLRGWYANVTHPATLDVATKPPTLFWRDLYLDVIALPDGHVVVRDEDELAASGLETSAPNLYSTVLDARNELLRRATDRLFPFHEGV